MIIEDTKKFIINLKRREDRKVNSIKEMEYMGWNNYEFFEGIDLNSYEGCGYSHMAVAKKFLETNDKYVIVLEDDLMFMPWAKKVISLLNERFKEQEIDILHFAPSIHRPLEHFDNLLVKLYDCPPKDPNKHRGIFGTSGFIYNRKVAEMIVKWDTNELMENKCKHAALDEFFDKIIYPTTKSFCPTFPLVTQYNDFSDINKTFDNNHYIMLYQWNSNITKLPHMTFDMGYIKEQRVLGNQIVNI